MALQQKTQYWIFMDYAKCISPLFVNVHMHFITVRFIIIYQQYSLTHARTQDGTKKRLDSIAIQLLEVSLYKHKTVHFYPLPPYKEVLCQSPVHSPSAAVHALRVYARARVSVSQWALEEAAVAHLT